MAKPDRRSPTIINSAWGALFMWDGRARNLEQQILLPIQSASEINMPVDQLMEGWLRSPNTVCCLPRASPKEA